MNWFLPPDGQIPAKLAGTVVLAVLLLLLRSFLVNKIISQNGKFASGIKRRWIVSIRNILLILFLIGLIFIWFEQLRTITTTVMVVGVAIVLATRDFLLNITGFFFRTGTHFFSTGERIEVDGIRGDVIDQSMLGVTILEIGPGKTNHIYTGKKIFIPNIKFLKSAVGKEAYLKDYVFHFITIPTKAGEDWIQAQECLLTAANEVCRPYLEDVRNRTKEIARKHSLNAPSITPRIQIQLPEADKINMILRVPLPANKRSRYEQKILLKYLQLTKERKSHEAVAGGHQNPTSPPDSGERTEA